MIKVMIIDDEPYIRKGLQILINWENYGFKISEVASNGVEALEILEERSVDLIITDIKMPKMDGIELINQIKKKISGDIRFIILSGFYEYEYAKKAIKYGVEDYILKPVQKEELIHLLEDYKEKYYKDLDERKRLEWSEKIVFDNYISHLLYGINTPEEIEYVRKYLRNDTEIRYIGMEYDQSNVSTHEPPEDDIQQWTCLYDAVKNYMGEWWYHVYFEADKVTDDNMVGFIYVKKLAEDIGLNEKEYIQKLYVELSEKLSEKIILFIGQKVTDITQIADSYKSALVARNFQRFSNENDVTFYDELVQSENVDRKRLHKEVLDELIRAIEENDETSILQQTDAVYKHFKEWVADPSIIKINLNYLLFGLVNLIKQIAPDVDHDEIYKMISLRERDQGVVRGSVKHIRAFSIGIAQYIWQLRQNVCGGVLNDVEREITENYAENLSLKTLSKKYYINSAYLGQIFKKKYGVTFKDYLNNYRIERAAELLLRSDKKIYLVSEDVGFHNTDYFVSKFVQIKGITPLQYRKQFMQSQAVDTLE